jgi:hypothetical protein
MFVEFGVKLGWLADRRTTIFCLPNVSVESDFAERHCRIGGGSFQQTIWQENRLLPFQVWYICYY